MQNELNSFNNANTEYQAKLQKDIQDAQLSDSHESKKLTKYQAEVGTYGAELNTNVQKFTQELTKNRASFDTSLQNYQAEVQKVTADNQAKLQLFTGEVSNFTQIIQKNSVDYQWLQSQHAQLRADYQQGLQLLVTGGVPQQQQQQGE
jgi:murein L,D-transpeptidase YcbB/YkuD